MIQDIIALTIVFIASTYTVYAMIKSFTKKKTSPCDGCTGCILKETKEANCSIIKREPLIQK